MMAQIGVLDAFGWIFRLLVAEENGAGLATDHEFCRLNYERVETRTNHGGFKVQYSAADDISILLRIQYQPFRRLRYLANVPPEHLAIGRRREKFRTYERCVGYFILPNLLTMRHNA